MTGSCGWPSPTAAAFRELSRAQLARYRRPVERGARLRLLAVLGVGHGLLAHPHPQRVLQLDLLDEQVVLGSGRGGRLRRLEVEAQELLHTGLSRPCRQVEEQGEVEHDR